MIRSAPLPSRFRGANHTASEAKLSNFPVYSHLRVFELVTLVSYPAAPNPLFEAHWWSKSVAAT